MKERKGTPKRKNWLLPTVLLLMVLVLISGTFLGIQISKYTRKDRYTEITLRYEQPKTAEETAHRNTEAEPLENAGVSAIQQRGQGIGESAVSVGAKAAAKPGLEVDGGTAGAEVVLFRAAYDGDGGMTVVESASGDKIVAPGTSHSHKIRLRNTGNKALQYTVYLRDLFPDAAENRKVPIEVRVTDYNGAYVLGNANTWISLKDMDQVIHSGTVGRNSYVYYTLQWRWAFEADRDQYDTALGNVYEEIVNCGIEVETYAEEHANPDAIGGISNPFTGDTAKLAIWTATAIVSAFVLFLLVVFYRRKEKEEVA